MNVRGERGSATLWALAVAMVVWSSMTAVVLVGVAIAARHRASMAADLAALAAATVESRPALPGARLSGGSTTSGCTAADAIALANDATLVACQVVGSVVEVTAAVRVPGLAHLALGSVSAKARAGAS